MGMQRPLPETDTDAGEFWRGAAAGKLLIQRCTRCNGYQHYARPFCVKCRHDQLEMVEVSGHGILHSFTVVHRGPYDDLPTPYVVGLIKLDEGVTLLSHVVDCDPQALSCDMPLEVAFRPLREGIVLPVFRPPRKP